MRLPLSGAILTLIFLGGCFAPVGQREAQQIAGRRLTRYCNGKCGAVTLAATHRIKDRWLVDFEAPRHKFTVIVESDGNSKVTTWDKQPGAISPR